MKPLMDRTNSLAVTRKYLCPFYETLLQQAKKKKQRRINPQSALENKISIN